MSKRREANAWLYDPALGRFLSPDPYVQMPDFTQNFNRYSYCVNNPLIYIDPSGEWFLIDLYPGPKDFFERVGYKVKSSNFSLEEIAYQLDKKNPVYISGYKESGFLNSANLFEGHAWVCDAYVKKTLQNNSGGRGSGGGRGSSRTRSTNNEVIVHYLHFNWGWNGSHNGWFSDGKTRWAYDYYNGSPERTDPMQTNRYPKLLKILSVEKR